MDADPLSTPSRPSKRPRTSIACEGCRSRKIRCDGGRPRCQACCNRGLAAACTYEASASIWDQDREKYIEQLERRLALLENSTSESDAGHRDLEHPVKRPRLERADTSHDSDDYVSVDEAPASGHPFNHDRRDAHHDHRHARDGSRGLDGRRGPSRDWDALSGPSFVELLGNLCKDRRSSNSPFPISSSFENRYFINLNRIFDSSVWPPKEDNFLLPTRKVADALVEEYFRTLFLTLPILDPKSFRLSYEKIWSSKKEEKTAMSTFFCLLNLLFALTANSKQELSPGQRSQAFLNRARNLIHVDACNEGSRELLPVLLLAAQSFESKDELQLARAASECAVDVARANNLDHSETSEFGMELAEKELSRRLWHSCVMVDRQASSGLGISPTVGLEEAERVALPQVHDVAHSCDFAASKTSGSEMPSPIFGLFVSLVRLSGITTAISVGTTVQDENPPTSRHSRDINLNKVVSLDQRLTQWMNRMPDHLRKSTHGPKLYEANHAYQANVLRQKYLHARLFLYRSCFAKYISSDRDRSRRGASAVDSTSPSLSPTPPRFQSQSRKRPRVTHGIDDTATSLQQSTVRVCAMLCAQAAKEIVELNHIQLAVKRAPNTLGAWWDNVSSTYDAAAILLSSQTSPTITGEIGPEISRAALKHCYSILHKSKPLGDQVQRSLRSLEHLREQLEVDPIEFPEPQEDPDRHEHQINIKDAAAYAASLDNQGPRRVSAPATVIGPHASSVQSQYGYVFAQSQAPTFGTPRQTAPPSLPTTAAEQSKSQYPNIFPISPPQGLTADMSSSLPTPVTTTGSQGPEYMTNMTTPQEMSFSWFDECNNMNVPFDFQFPTPVSAHPQQPPTHFTN